jgi:hypothetical protein
MPSRRPSVGFDAVVVVVVVVLSVVVVADVVVVAVACPVGQPAITSALITISHSHDACLVVTHRRYIAATTP